MTTNDGTMNTTLPAAAAAAALRSSAIRSSTAKTLKLNQGRIYDCGRVPPIPKQLQRKQQKQQQQHPSSLLSTMTTTSESSSDKDDEDPSADINHHDDDDDNDNTSSLLHYLISSHTNKRRGSFSKSGWLRRIVRGQIRIRIENGSTSIIMTNPCYKILTKENVKQQIEYYRRPWYEPIIPVKVALLDDDINDDENNNYDDENVLKILYIDNHIMAVHKPSGLPTMPSQTYYEYSVLNTLRRLYNNNNDNDNNKNEPCKNNPVTMSSEDDDDDDGDMNRNRNVKELIQKYCSAPPQPVHRLGVGTSGILLIATSFIGRQQLTKSIRSKTEMSSKNKHKNKKFKSSDCCRKIYRALVYAYRNDNRSSLSSSSSNNNDNNDTTTIKKILIPDFMTIDCPIGPTPFPIGGGTIHAACPSNTTTFNTKEKDDEEEEESLSSLLYGHVHVHKNDNAFHEDHDPDGGDSAADNNNDNVDVNQAKNEDKNIKSALSYVKVIRRNINNSPTNTENGNNDDNDNDNDGYPHHKSSSSSKLLLDNTALVEIEIPTGRPHQIRIHMSYAGYALVDDPLYLPGGIPSHEKKQFPIRKKEDEDIETDTEDEEEKEEHTSNKTTTTSRVTLPRDCGYHLHAYQISIENPSYLSSKNHTNATSVDHDGHDNGNGIDSKSATTTTKEKMMMTFIAPPPAILG